MYICIYRLSVIKVYGTSESGKKASSKLSKTRSVTENTCPPKNSQTASKPLLFIFLGICSTSSGKRPITM